MSTYTPIDFQNNPPKLSMLGLSDDVFSIVGPADNLSLDTQIIFIDSVVGEKPELDLELVINDNTSKILFFTDTSWNEAITTFYHIIYDPDAILFEYTSNNIGIVEYTYNASTQVLNSNIISHGKFIANKYPFDQALWQIYQSQSIDFDDLDDDLQNNNISGSFINNIIGYKVNNVDIISFGSGYKLNSTFFLRRSSFTSELLPENCELSADLCLCSDTVSISGGSNYKVGDTFTIGTEEQTSVTALIRVTAVNSLGSILDIEIVDNGSNFTSLPTVIDNSDTGSNANITVSDSFGILACDIISSGNGYNIYDNTISCRYNNIEYDPTDRARTYTDITLLKILPLLNNNFSLDNIVVTQPGNNISEANFIIINNNTIIDNNFITINKDNLIDIKSLLNITNRPRFQFN